MLDETKKGSSPVYATVAAYLPQDVHPSSAFAQAKVECDQGAGLSRIARISLRSSDGAYEAGDVTEWLEVQSDECFVDDISVAEEGAQDDSSLCLFYDDPEVDDAVIGEKSNGTPTPAVPTISATAISAGTPTPCPTPSVEPTVSPVPTYEGTVISFPVNTPMLTPKSLW